MTEHDSVRQSYDAVRAQAAALAELRAEQGLVTAVFADLERALPEGVQLLRLELQGSQAEHGWCGRLRRGRGAADA
jgi:Fimbrial assembly protein (PilN).